MVITHASLPVLPLQRYIKRYCLREIDTGGEVLLKPLFADGDSILALALTDTPVWYHTAGVSREIDLRERHLFGLQTVYNGYQIFKGRYRLLCIEFNANGFYSLFQVPMRHIRNSLWCFDDVIGQRLSYLSEQLHDLPDFGAIVAHMDRFFMQALQKRPAQRKYAAEIAWACDRLGGSSPMDMRSLAASVNMSLRNFEQQFMEQVGMSPVVLKKIKRFHQAVALKTQFPDLSWTSIAYECSYFDQMHLIRDFKVFSSLSPKAFFRQMPPPKEQVVILPQTAGTC